MPLTEIPAWVQDELDSPCGLGEGRNDQMISIGPTLIRAGHDVDTLFEVFCGLYGDLDESQQREVAAVCRQSVKYAAREDAQLMKGEFIERKKVLNELARQARELLPEILSAFRWPLSDIVNSGLEFNEVSEGRWFFLENMFKPADVVWIGEVWETGVRERRGVTVNYASRFKSINEWANQPQLPRGEFVSHCTFKPGTNSRCNEAVQERKFMVVESDLLGVDEVGAVFNYLAANQGLTLRAIVSTGGKSIHAWFNWPKDANEARMEEWAATLQGLKCDPSTLRPSQPVRLPGVIRRDTKRPQELLWLA